MNMTYEQFYTKLIEYINTRFIPKLTNDLNKFKVGFMIPLLDSRLKSVYSSYTPDDVIVNSDGLINVDNLEKCVDSGFDKSTLHVGGFTFEKCDADEFFEFIKQ